MRLNGLRVESKGGVRDNGEFLHRPRECILHVIVII
jgi:hypothetical protein